MEAQKANMDNAFSHLKIYIGLLFVLFGFTVQAQTVDGEKAMELANIFVNSRMNNDNTEKSMHNLELVSSAKFSSGQNNELKSVIAKKAFHIVNVGNNEGFIIIAGDKRSTPVLGYSTTGNFDIDNVPEQLNALLGAFEEEISTVVANDLEQSIAPNKEWEKFSVVNEKSATSGNGFTLLKTKWNQNKYYNEKCPEDSRSKSTYNGHVPAGCVPVSLSQIMKFWEWPTSGESNLCYTPSGSNNYGEQCADFEKNYAFNSMPEELNSASTANQKDVVSQLIYDLAVATKTTFNYNGSSASSSSAKRAMINNFNYSPKSELVYKSQYSEEEWIALLKEHLDNNIPIYYRGDNNGAFGHAWICDGYDDENRFHFNWGWGGTYDGFYALDAVKPASNYNLTFHQGAIINLFPDNEDYTIENMEVGNKNVTPEETLEVGFTQVYKGFDYSESQITFSYYLSVDEKPSSNDVLLGVEKVAFSKAKNSFDKKETYTIPANTAYGTYYLILVADSKNACKENNENNNIALTKISVSEPVSNDFLVGDAYIESEELQSGDHVILSCKQMYDGNAGIEVGVKSGYYLSSDEQLDETDLLLGEELSSLSLNKNYEIESLKVKIPTETPAGNYYVLFVTDPANEYEETKEDNNLSSFEITVSECGDFLEPNNSKDEASFLGDLYTYMNDNLCVGNGDEDWLRFEANSNTFYLKIDNLEQDLSGTYGLDISDENGVLYIETFKTNNNTDTRISLYDSKFNLIASDDDGGDDKFSKIVFNYLLAGPLNVFNNSGLNIYPNPTRGKLTIDTSLKEISEEIIVTILDARGAILRQTDFNYYNDVDLSDFPRGEYIIALTSDTGLRQSKKVIKN